MLNITNDTVLIGTTELRSEMGKLTKALEQGEKAILMKRGDPFAVMENYETYKEKEELLETLEDLILGYFAKERDSNSTEKDFIDEKEMIKRLGLII